MAVEHVFRHPDDLIQKLLSSLRERPPHLHGFWRLGLELVGMFLEGFWMVFGDLGSKSTPNRAKIARNRVRIEKKSFKKQSWRLQAAVLGEKAPQSGQKTAQRGPNVPQECPRGAQERPRGSKRRPEVIQEAPNGGQSGPKRIPTASREPFLRKSSKICKVLETLRLCSRIRVRGCQNRAEIHEISLKIDKK